MDEISVASHAYTTEINPKDQDMKHRPMNAAELINNISHALFSEKDKSRKDFEKDCQKLESKMKGITLQEKNNTLEISLLKRTVEDLNDKVDKLTKERAEDIALWRKIVDMDGKLENLEDTILSMSRLEDQIEDDCENDGKNESNGNGLYMTAEENNCLNVMNMSGDGGDNLQGALNYEVSAKKTELLG